MKHAEKMNSEFIKDMKQEFDWISKNYNAISYLVSQALVARNTSSLPAKGGLFDQNYWFVLVLNELNIYLKKLEYESLG
ncbi:hypothetical protein [Borrelia sp. A-FGy1]|uniref:hypothetical protein n=1 Tax=Borrelia sp. A-FGy1 TaxID=2608247 RepID=UPI001E3EC32D|nr:hypothetical protein [Borrelia sp. A-FGy1]